MNFMLNISNYENMQTSKEMYMPVVKLMIRITYSSLLVISQSIFINVMTKN